MEGEIQYFRKSFIGGFNRDDVVAYIATLSNERNEAVKAAERATAEINKLKKKLVSLQKRFSVYEELVKEINSQAETIRHKEELATPPEDGNVPQPQIKEKPVIVIKRKKS